MKLTGTAVLCALVYVFDWGLKSSGLRLPFIWMPTMKFDFTGIPIALSMFLYGLPATATTSITAFLIIVMRGDPVGASMKSLAEFSTMVGLSLASQVSRAPRILGSVTGVLLRVIVMVFANMAVLPVFYKTPLEVAIISIPLIAVFNTLQGLLSVFGGYSIYKSLERRTPSLLEAMRSKGRLAD